MLDDVANFFKSEEVNLKVTQQGKPTEKDLLISTVVLMIEMASQDKSVAPAEAKEICNSVGKAFGIAQKEIPELVKIAVAARNEKGKLDEFITCINKNFADEQKIIVLSMIWKVVMADGKIDAFEKKFAVDLRKRFELSSEQGAEARKIASQDYEFQ